MGVCGLRTFSQFPGGHGWRERESQYRDKDGVVLELCRTKIEKETGSR